MDNECEQLPVFTSQPLRAVGVLFSPMVGGWAGGRSVGRREKVLLYLMVLKIFPQAVGYGLL